MKRLAVFDLDGTLLDTIGDLAAAQNYALSQSGFPEHPVDAYKQFVGDGVYKMVERSAPEKYRTNAQVLTTLKEGFDAYYDAHTGVLTHPYPKVPELLEALRQKDIICAVLSNKPHAFTQKLCTQYFPGCFAWVTGHREGYAHKPDRSLVEEILANFGVSAQESLYIGDSGVDMQTAKNSGVFAVGVLWGFRSREELESNGADALVSDPMQILAYIGA